MESHRDQAQLAAFFTESQLDDRSDSAEEGPSDAELEKLKPFVTFLDEALQNPLLNDALTDTRSIGQFRVLGILGRGGSSVVYLGVDPNLGRQVALKVPRDSLFLSDDARERFLQEAKIIAELRNPNIVEIYDIGDTKACPFLVIEYCSGGALQEWLDPRTEPLTPACCAAIIRQLASATAHAHAHGIVHRDINPRNVLLVPRAEIEKSAASAEFPFVAKLSDFGLGTWLDDDRTAVRTRTGAVIGTLHYMAPEQTRSAPISAPHLVDVYALGVMLYELLTRQLPFYRSSAAETIRLIQEIDAAFPRASRRSIPSDLATICLTCLEKSPLVRYQSAADLTEDLDLHLAGRPIRAKRRHFITLWRRSIRRHRERIVAASFITVLLVAICVGGMWLTQELRELSTAAARLKADFDKKEAEASAAAMRELQEKGKNQILERHKAELEQEQAERSNHWAKSTQRKRYADKILRISASPPMNGYGAIQKLRGLVPGAGEPDERGFEWRYLMQLFGGDIAPMIVLPTDANEYIGQMHITPDGKSLFESRGGKLREWDLNSGRWLREACSYSGSIRDFLVFHDSSRLAVGIYHRNVNLKGLTATDVKQLTNFTTDEHVGFTHRLIPPPLFLSPVFFSIRGNQREISAPTEIWSHDINTGESRLSTKWPDREIRDMIFDPAEQTAIYTSRESILVHRNGGELVQELTLNGRPSLQALTVSANGRFLAVSQDDNETILFEKSREKKWERAASVPVVNRRMFPRSEQFEFTRNPVRLSQNGARLYSAYDIELHQTDLPRRKVINSVNGLHGSEIRSLELLPDGETVAWASDKAVGLWHPIEGVAPISGHQKEAWSVSYSPDGTIMATGSDDETVRLWTTATGHMIAELGGHLATVTQVSFSPDGTRLASGSLDGTVRIWDVPSRTLVRSIEGNQGVVRALTWFKDSQRLAIGDSIHEKRHEPNKILIWDTATGTLLKTCATSTSTIRSLLITEDQESVISFAGDDVARVWNLKGNYCQVIPCSGIAVRCGALLNEGRQFVVGDNTGRIQIRHTTTGEIKLEIAGHDRNILSIAVSPDGRQICSGGEDHFIRLWDAETLHLLLTLDENDVQVNCVTFSPDGQTLAAALHDGSVKLYHAPRIDRLLRGLDESSQLAIQGKPK
jgi:serine/threonine protein kinase/WD40 repeat protein